MIIVNALDMQKLKMLRASHWRLRDKDQRPLERLMDEIAHAIVMTPEQVPPDVVTMNSEVWIRDLASNERVTYTLVFPWKVDISKGKISVLAPIGTALLGVREGDVIRVTAPGGIRELQVGQRNLHPGALVEQIAYQPEAAGLAA